MSAISPRGERTLHDLEAIIETGKQTFIEVGLALMEVRDRRLYRAAGFPTFDEKYCVERWQFSRRHAGRLVEAASTAATLADGLDDKSGPIGPLPATESQARELAPLVREDPEQARAVWREVVDEAEETEQPITAAKVREAVQRGRPAVRITRNTGDYEWYSPRAYVEAARAVLGGIDLDPASTPIANAVVGATAFYSEVDNGLAQPWYGRVWLNPPYAQPLIEHFCDRLVECYVRSDVSAARVLVNNATDTTWFHTLAAAASAICFPRGRVKFWRTDRTDSGAGALQGQAIVYLGPDVACFERVFAPRGFVVVPSRQLAQLRDGGAS